MSTAENGDTFDLTTAHFNPDTVAIVTGGADGLGRAFSEAMLQKGVKGICLADINVEKGEETLKEFKKYGEEKVIFLKCDVTSEEEFEAAFTKTKEHFGTVNLLVNNAGIQNEKNWKRCIDVNMIGTMTGTYIALERMSLEEGGEGGTIINIASMAGLAPVPYMPTYAATKHAVLGMSTSLMIHPGTKASKGITMGVLCPTFTDTTMIDESKIQLRCDSDLIMARAVQERIGVLSVSDVTDAFLTLVLDKSWEGKVLTISKRDGIRAKPIG